MGSILQRRIFREGAWVAAGEVLSAVAALASLRIMTELLPTAEFGRFTLLVGIAALALGLVATPKLQAVLRYYPDWQVRGEVTTLRSVAGGQIARQVILAVNLLVAGGIAASFLTGQVWYAGVLVAMLLVAEALRSFELAFFNAARRQRSGALIRAADAWLKPIMAIGMVLLLGNTSEAALVGSILGAFLILALMRRLVRLEGLDAGFGSQQPTGDASSRDELARAIRRYALPLTPLAIFGWFSGMGDRYVIAGVLSLSDVGLYAAIYGLASRPFLMLSGIIEMTLRPVLQNAIASGSHDRIRKAKYQLLLVTSVGAAFGVLCFVALSSVAAKVFLAEEYRSAAHLMPWIALGYAFLSVSSMYSRICYAFDATGSILILTVAGALTGVAVLVPAALAYGLAGAVAAVPVGFGVELILSALFARRAEARLLAGQSEGRHAAH